MGPTHLGRIRGAKKVFDTFTKTQVEHLRTTTQKKHRALSKTIQEDEAGTPLVLPVSNFGLCIDQQRKFNFKISPRVEGIVFFRFRLHAPDSVAGSKCWFCALLCHKFCDQDLQAQR